MQFRHWLNLSFLFGLCLLPNPNTWADNEAAEARMKRDLFFLAAPECEGRGVETEGINRAADYVATEFKKAGLKSGVSDGSFFQPFTVSGSAKLEGKPSVILHGPQGQQIELNPDTDFQVMGVSGTGKVTAPVVFAGFGVTAPKANYDDYKDLDVTGKVVLVLRKTPRYQEGGTGFDDTRQDEHAALPRKQSLAELNKAAAVLVVNDLGENAKGDVLPPFSNLANAGSSGTIPAFHLKRSLGDWMVQSGTGQPLKEIEQAINHDLKPRSTPLTGWTATVETKVQRKTVPVKNVVAVAEGTGPLANETVVVGAHYDHLGFGGRGSRSKTPAKKEIHHGADDNASGTTALLELARRFAKPGREGRRILFIAFSAEETGLLGSRHYTKKEPLFPLEYTAAMLNLDMVGRVTPDKDSQKDKLIVEGLGTAKGFEQVVDKANGNPGFQLVKKQGGLGPSDHDSFTREKIPVLFFWTGVHSDYHMPTDTADKINVAGMGRVANVAEKVIHELSTMKRPEYVQVAGSKDSLPRAKGPRLGIMPDYEADKEGVLIGGVLDDGPAAKAGMKTGDRIVEIAGKRVPNLETYMVMMGMQQVGQAVEIGVLREGKKVTLKVVPQ